MKETYAVRRTVLPSAEIQASIDKLLGKGMVDDPQKMLSELGRLGARLIISGRSRTSLTGGWAALAMSVGRRR
jgi:adenylosuccinate synthase